jgi:hypothetical protein
MTKPGTGAKSTCLSRAVVGPLIGFALHLGIAYCTSQTSKRQRHRTPVPTKLPESRMPSIPDGRTSRLRSVNSPAPRPWIWQTALRTSNSKCSPASRHPLGDLSSTLSGPNPGPLRPAVATEQPRWLRGWWQTNARDCDSQGATPLPNGQSRATPLRSCGGSGNGPRHTGRSGAAVKVRLMVDGVASGDA